MALDIIRLHSTRRRGTSSCREGAQVKQTRDPRIWEQQEPLVGAAGTYGLGAPTRRVEGALERVERHAIELFLGIPPQQRV